MTYPDELNLALRINDDKRGTGSVSHWGRIYVEKFFERMLSGSETCLVDDKSIEYKKTRLDLT